jgi:signal transduction histidine kinase
VTACPRRGLIRPSLGVVPRRRKEGELTSVAQAQPAATPSIGASIAPRRSIFVSIALGGVLAAVGGGLVVATSDHLRDPVAYGVELALATLGAVAAALYWLARRPGNRLGWLLLGLAGATGALTLQGASSPLLHSLGVLADPIMFLLGYYVVFAFPHGRLTGLWEKALLAAMSAYFLVAFVPWFFFSPVVSGGAPLAACNAECPSNPLMIEDRPSLAAGFGSNLSYAVIVIMCAAIACLTYRLGTATRPRVRALVPVYGPALVLSIPVLLFHGVVVDLADLDGSSVRDLGWVLTAGRILLPFGFLLAIVQAAFFSASALKHIVGELARSPTAPRLRTILARALDDPSLEIGFRVESSEEFVDSGGTPIAPHSGTGRTATPVSRNGDPVAVIVHDAALDTDPELVSVAAQAVLLALDNDRLATEVRLANAELHETRARMVAAGDAERRKIERDLHDGAQQHLVALRIKVGLASELADPRVALRLADIGGELEEILEELRDLSHGLYPPTLRLYGLHRALANVARRAATPVQLQAATSIGRYPEHIEAAVYFCCVESLQNVAKHAGARASALIRLAERGGRLHFEVEDDGVGYDGATWRSGAGHANMRDRMAAVDGTLTVESSPGNGASVRGVVPVCA